MMVQGVPEGEPHFLCLMREHNAFCGQLVRAFGNERFERCEPFEEMVYVVSHHDYGWDAFDAKPEMDSKSGLPRGIGASAPALGNGVTGRLSAEVNEEHDSYCGLLASMHSWGLYNARYGCSEFRVRPGGSTSIPIPDSGPVKDAVGGMLEGEVRRQERLKAEIGGQPGRRDWVEDAHIIQNYKQFQFFDTLALYFHLRHETERAQEAFVNVPMSIDRRRSRSRRRTRVSTRSIRSRSPATGSRSLAPGATCGPMATARHPRIWPRRWPRCPRRVRPIR